MCIHRMDAAIRNQTHEMKGGIFACVNRGKKRRIFKEFSAADHFVDPRHLYLDDSAGTHVHMANLGIAELTGRQSDMFAGTFYRCMFKFLKVSVKERSMS